ncbi:MAG: 2-dehydro-3-deoxygalactonokinase [Phyllobacteriaceae bacterium]|nr:2-dehydro-3-deoxygalactonokinase [Phyllobacteriaceae bacterium]
MAAPKFIAGLDWIAVDWGTSALRVWAMGSDGANLARAFSSRGMSNLTPDGYEPALLELVGGWLPTRIENPVPVLVCGMAGARQGWREAGYRAVPCLPVDEAGLAAVETRDRRIAVRIVPGLRQESPPDVMRGEETQLAGLIAGGIEDGVVCLPGTHGKWVRIEAGRVAGFTTAMTGELFAAIGAHTLLRHSIAAEGMDKAAFAEAVSAMLANPARLTVDLFGIRAAGLLHGLGAVAARSRLSGLLIGAELAAIGGLWSSREVHIVGAGPLAEAYGEALAAHGARAFRHDAGMVTLAGLARVRRMSGAGP